MQKNLKNELKKINEILGIKVKLAEKKQVEEQKLYEKAEQLFLRQKRVTKINKKQLKQT